MKFLNRALVLVLTSTFAVHANATMNFVGLSRGSDEEQPKQSRHPVIPSREFEHENLNQRIDLDQGKEAIAEKYGIGFVDSSPEHEYKQLKLSPLVEKTELRAMRISDLKSVEHVVRHRCEREGWVSVYDGSLLTPRQVNLYDLNYYYILPSSVPNGVILHGLKKRNYKKGDLLMQEVSSDHMKFQKPFGEVMEDCEGGDVLVRVTRGRFTKTEKVFLQTDNDDSTSTRSSNDVSSGEDCGSPTFVQFKDGVRMSLKEKLHPQPTQPDWFISHSWSDSVISFVERCEKHAYGYCSTWNPSSEPDFDEEMFNNYSYWISAYANNQHELATEIVGSPMNSPFMKAIDSSNGTLIMMDREADMLSRIWCDFEIFMAMMDSKTLDVAGVDENGEPCLLTQKVLPSDEDAEDKVARDQEFPRHLLQKGMTVVLEKGNTSHDIDKIRILKAMVPMKNIIDGVDVNWDDEGPFKRLSSISSSSLNDENKSYQLANDMLRARFAVFAWPQAHKLGKVKDFSESSTAKEEDTSVLDLPAITSKAALLNEYEITLIDTDKDSFLDAFRGIPPNCRRLRLEFHDGKEINDGVFFNLWEKLATLDHLRHFDIKIGNLSNVHTDEMITHSERGLAALLPKYRKLETLILDIEGDTFQYRSCLSEASVAALRKAIKSGTPLTTLKFDFGGWYDESRVFQMESTEDILDWSVDQDGSKFRRDRVDHGFGNTLSTFPIHAARDSDV